MADGDGEERVEDTSSGLTVCRIVVAKSNQQGGNCTSCKLLWDGFFSSFSFLFTSLVRPIPSSLFSCNPIQRLIRLNLSPISFLSPQLRDSMFQMLRKHVF